MTVKTVHYLPVLLSTILYFLSTTAGAAPPPSNLQVYETFAPAKVVRNYISPLLKDGENISLFRGKIIVNASAHTHSRILELLDKIDHRAQKLLIHFRPSQTANKRSVNKNDTNKQAPSIVRFSGSSTDGKIIIEKQNHPIDTELTRKEEYITLLEGKIGYLKGSTEGYKNTPVFADGFFSNKLTLKKNGSGHYISARVNGNTATLQIAKKAPHSIKNTTSSQADLPSSKELTASLGTWTLIPPTNGQPSNQEIRVQLAP